MTTSSDMVAQPESQKIQNENQNILWTWIRILREYVESAGDNIYAKSAEQRERQQREPNSMDQLAAQLNINPPQSEDLQPINARQFQQQFEQAFGNVLFNDTAASSSGCEFVQLQPTTSASSSEKVATTMSRGGSLLNQNLLDLYSKMP
ncbi:GD25858 [Drosophila simulans]|uniref:GD25858 n=1 Tax=Drosophila simulans TaxID=7240 RepID=B4QC83_DROSI|nr:GD25858 [Drosophila simulans]